MLLTLTTTHRPATDLGYLLHKHPARVQQTELGFGHAHMLFPAAREDLCRFALLLDVDPVGLVRGTRRPEHALLDHYVNDRPYAASSFFSVAMARTLRTAINGVCKERPELAETAIPLEATVGPVAVRGGGDLPARLFGPLGYAVEVRRGPLDETVPDWGESPYVELTLKATSRLQDLLGHLYVLIPVLDHDKHYFVSRDELEKLIDKGAGWLAGHPERELIARRYLSRKPSLAREALERLVGEEADPVELEAAAVKDTMAEAAAPATVRLHDLRLDRVAAVLKEERCRRVVDLGCGEGRLLERLLADRSFEEILGIDVSTRALEIAERRLRLQTLPERQRGRIRLAQGALTYRDRRIEGFEAATLVEVIEHLDPDRLSALERVLFEHARPRLVVITTPNREYNAKFEKLSAGAMRHADHRFEWTRGELAAWAGRQAERFGYQLRIEPLGEADPDLGAPSQMAVFTR